MLKVIQKSFAIVAILAVTTATGLLNIRSTHAEGIDYSVTVQPSLSISVSSSDVVLNLNPAIEQFSTKDLTVTVGTNNIYGYRLYVNTADGSTDLVKTDDAGTKMGTISTATDQASFPANRWGYKVSSNALSHTNFNPFVPDTVISQSSTVTNADVSTLTFAAKADYEQPAGSYQLDLEFKALPAVTVYTMQEIGASAELASAVCSSEPTVVTDERDGQMYVIERLKDGNCWMMSNLNLGATPLVQDLTSADTNIVGTVPASTFNGWKKTAGSNSYTAGEYISVSGNDSNNGMPFGVLYNYCSASAGTICSDGNSYDATYDICPAGWKMPSGGDNSDYSKLYNYYNSSADMRASYYDGGAAFTLAGIFASGAPSNQNEYGRYWSSTYSSTGYMYTLTLSNSSVDPAVRYFRYGGRSIRCKLQNPLEEAHTMQALSSAAVAAATDGMTATLTDTRDRQQYSVVKYGNLVWMTRNLAIGCNGTGVVYGGAVSSKTLTPSDSNISAASWSTPTALLSTAANSSATSGYVTPAMQCNSTYGAFYNYAATSAGTIVGNDNSDEAQFSICPSGWRLFTSTEATEAIATVGFQDVFKPVAGGRYDKGTLSNLGVGNWLTSTAATAKNRYKMLYNTDEGNTLTVDNLYRYRGYYVRCVKSTS